uniref:Uncharacterized protein n=1 Tax=Peronospora matthiolae TaxID=2874970 RepID=A0AAV1UUB6_9STRA
MDEQLTQPAVHLPPDVPGCKTTTSLSRTIACGQHPFLEHVVERRTKDVQRRSEERLRQHHMDEPLELR